VIDDLLIMKVLLNMGSTLAGTAPVKAGSLNAVGCFAFTAEDLKPVPHGSGHATWNPLWNLSGMSDLITQEWILANCREDEKLYTKRQAAQNPPALAANLAMNAYGVDCLYLFITDTGKVIKKKKDRRTGNQEDIPIAHVYWAQAVSNPDFTTPKTNTRLFLGIRQDIRQEDSRNPVTHSSTHFSPIGFWMVTDNKPSELTWEVPRHIKSQILDRIHKSI
jgi:hypothetical protein